MVKRSIYNVVAVSALVWMLLQTVFYLMVTQYSETVSLFASGRTCSSPCVIYQDKQTPWVYVITPTYQRPTQKAELTRLSHTFRLVPKLHWIVVEDATSISSLVTNLLIRSTLPHTQLSAQTTNKYKLKANEASWKKPRGVWQRNAGIEWLRNNRQGQEGVVYFADDDNTYDLQLFEEMRSTRRVSVWPVGLVGAVLVESPKVKNGKVVGWHTSWRPDRPYATDMAGFAVNLSYLLNHPEASFNEEVENGFQESHFLKLLVPVSMLEPKAGNCTKVYVWHTRTEKPKLTGEDKLRKKGIIFSAEIEV